MIRGLYIASTGMITKQIQQENLTNNIANINNAGYKGDKIAFKAFKDVMVENYDKKIGNRNFRNQLGTMSTGVAIDETKTDFSQGIIEDTGRNLDFAIEGEGFFTVTDENNNRYYTRNGRFKIDSDGDLATLDGKKVIGLNSNNQETTIKINSSDFVLNNNAIGNVKLLISNGDMSKINENYYTSNNATESQNSKVYQSKLEKSNVDTIEIITELISVMRNYESNQKVIQSMDETLGKTVNEIGSINR